MSSFAGLFFVDMSSGLYNLVAFIGTGIVG